MFTSLLQSLTVPVMAAPMFTVSYPELVIAQCRAGVIGSFPALNARPQNALTGWLSTIEAALAPAHDDDGTPLPRPAPFAVNLILHESNARLKADFDVCVAHRVPIYITSLQAPPRWLVDAAHAYGGLIFHDVTTIRHARKALMAGVDGLILVAAGAGGHGGTASPFALVSEVRAIFDGPIALAGAINRGHEVLAARTMGADLAYMGTRFIATQEAAASEAYKRALTDATLADIVYTDHFTGIPGNYLSASIVAAGLAPDAVAGAGRVGSEPAKGVGLNDKQGKPWKDIWGAGHGAGGIADTPPVAELVARLADEYKRACDGQFR